MQVGKGIKLGLETKGEKSAGGCQGEGELAQARRRLCKCQFH